MEVAGSICFSGDAESRGITVVLALSIGDKQVEFTCDSMVVANSIRSALGAALGSLNSGTRSWAEDGVAEDAGAELQRSDNSIGMDCVPSSAFGGRPGEVAALTG